MVRTENAGRTTAFIQLSPRLKAALTDLPPILPRLHLDLVIVSLADLVSSGGAMALEFFLWLVVLCEVHAVLTGSKVARQRHQTLLALPRLPEHCSRPAEFV